MSNYASAIGFGTPIRTMYFCDSYSEKYAIDLSRQNEGIATIVERTKPQPKTWSGPEDGLPPINARLYMRLDESDEWILGTVIAHVTLEDGDVAVAHNGKYVFNGYASDFRAVWTPESRESERRETAIRELMDIAQVDCRVTAARLVDAGFKREVV